MYSIKSSNYHLFKNYYSLKISKKNIGVYTMCHATNIDNTGYRVPLVPYISGVELDTSAINFISACPEMTRSNILLVA